MEKIYIEEKEYRKWKKSVRKTYLKKIDIGEKNIERVKKSGKNR